MMSCVLWMNASLPGVGITSQFPCKVSTICYKINQGSSRYIKSQVFAYEFSFSCMQGTFALFVIYSSFSTLPFKTRALSPLLFSGQLISALSTNHNNILSNCNSDFGGKEYGWMDFRKLRLSVGCTGAPWGTRDQAYSNRNTVLIHHPVFSEVIKSNYIRPLHPHLNLPPDGDPAEQQVASLHKNMHPTTVIWIHGNNAGRKVPDTHVKYEMDV